VQNILPEDAEDKRVTFSLVAGSIDAIITEQNGAYAKFNANGNTGYAIFIANAGSKSVRDSILFVSKEPGWGEDVAMTNKTYHTYDFGLPVGRWFTENLTEAVGTHITTYPGQEAGARGYYYRPETPDPCVTPYQKATTKMFSYIGFIKYKSDLRGEYALSQTAFSGYMNVAGVGWEDLVAVGSGAGAQSVVGYSYDAMNWYSTPITANNGKNVHAPIRCVALN
jgi:hypothetical protein